jgi:hypothetical protein
LPWPCILPSRIASRPMASTKVLGCATPSSNSSAAEVVGRVQAA